jgi:general secretion pathway protein G
VEVLIVVVILGILAAVVVPQFADASDEAKEATLLNSIQTLRRQVNLYEIEHQGRPIHQDESGKYDRLNATTRLVEKTDADGKLNPNGKYGPYLQSWPANPFCDEATASLLMIGLTDLPPRNGITGWYYNIYTHKISSNSTVGGESADNE